MNNFPDIPMMLRGFVETVYALTLAEVKDLLQRGKLFNSLDEIMDLIDKHWEAVLNKPGVREDILTYVAGLSPDKQETFNEAKTVAIPRLFIPYFTREQKVCTPAEVSEPMPVCDGYHWKLLRNHLLTKFPEPTVDSIDKQSSLVLRHILLPKDNKPFRKTGLVVGQVQSGKTANYTALIAKATDCGYKIIIVLSGIHNDLRNQTQERLDEEFVGFHRYCMSDNKDNVPAQKKVLCGIGLDGDFDENKVNVGTYTDDDFRGHQGVNTPILFVVKKNTDVFKNLKNFFSGDSIRNLPTLIIDDEADQASVNTKRNDNSTINGDIRELIKNFPRASFIGYTATPFANVFIDAQATDDDLGDDLFPRDFIERLPVPLNYFGPLQFFGDGQENHGLELFMPVSVKTSRILSGRKKKGKGYGYRLSALPEECKNAFYQFLISAGIRQWRDKKNNPDNWVDDGDNEQAVLKQSMLVHISYRIFEQEEIARRFSDFIEPVRDVLLQGSDYQKREILDILRVLFENQKEVTQRTRKFPNCTYLSTDWSLPASFEELLVEIESVLEDLMIVCINGQSNDEPVLDVCEESFDRPHGKNIIYIGGNKLSRGLTLPGLCVSFFLRSTTMYDTLLQMGRWFGYRNGYVDLCRISTTPKTIERFRAITEACMDFERQIDSMSSQNRTPNNYRLRVLSHPGLLVTARNKMRHVINARIGFNNDTYGQRYLSVNEKDITSNLKVAYQFYKAVKATGTLKYASEDYGLGEFPRASFYKHNFKPSGRLWSDVPAEVIVDFLSSYTEEAGKCNAHIMGIAKHIKRVQKKNELVKWNVFIPGAADLKGNRFDLNFVQRRIGRTVPQTRDFDIDSIVLPELKTGWHEYVGVSKEIMDAATDVVDKLHKTQDDVKGALFRAVRHQAGKIDPTQGYFILYLFNSEEMEGRCSGLEKVRRYEGGEKIPLVAFYLWTPDSANETFVNMSVFNQTVNDSDDDDDYDDED